MALQEQTARIAQKQEEVRQFSAEMRAASATDARTLWMYPVGGMIVGGALFATGMVAGKLIGL